MKVVEPSGFEALTGVSISAPLRAVERAADKPAPSAAQLKAAKREEQRQERARAESERKRKLAIAKAKARVAAAAQAENRARFEWERAKKDVEAAERALGELFSGED